MLIPPASVRETSSSASEACWTSRELGECPPVYEIGRASLDFLKKRRALERSAHFPWGRESCTLGILFI